MYLGGEGVPKDSDKAISFFQSAAEGGEGGERHRLNRHRQFKHVRVWFPPYASKAADSAEVDFEDGPVRIGRQRQKETLDGFIL